MEILTRTQAISRLRSELLKLADDEHSVCEVATSKGIFCKGFDQFTDQELFFQYKWLVKALGISKRKDLEHYANLWQLTRQRVHGLATACDVQCEEQDTCSGWDTFSNEQFELFLSEVCGLKATVVPDALHTHPPITV